MVKAGFHYEGTQDGISLLTGDFAGYKNCIVGVSTLKNLNVVSHIAVLFPDKDTWTSVLSDYETLKSLLTEKYGIPSDNRERFIDYNGNDNALIMYALKDVNMNGILHSLQILVTLSCLLFLGQNIIRLLSDWVITTRSIQRRFVIRL